MLELEPITVVRSIECRRVCPTWTHIWSWIKDDLDFRMALSSVPSTTPVSTILKEYEENEVLPEDITFQNYVKVTYHPAVQELVSDRDLLPENPTVLEMDKFFMGVISVFNNRISSIKAPSTPLTANNLKQQLTAFSTETSISPTT